MPSKQSGKRKQQQAAPAATPAAAEFGPHDANELEPLPSGKAYESLDEGDAPPRADQLLEDEQLLGLQEQAPTKEPAETTPPPAASPAPAGHVRFSIRSGTFFYKFVS